MDDPRETTRAMRDALTSDLGSIELGVVFSSGGTRRTATVHHGRARKTRVGPLICSQPDATKGDGYADVLAQLATIAGMSDRDIAEMKVTP